MYNKLMLKKLKDYRKENYLVNSYQVAINKKWCMQTTCSTCGAMRLREFLFECATKNELKETDKDELKRTTPFYPRTSNMPKEIQDIVIKSHKNELSKIKNELEDIQRCFNDDMNSVLIRDFKTFLRFIIMDIWDSMRNGLTWNQKLAELKMNIDSKDVHDLVDEMKEHYYNH